MDGEKERLEKELRFLKESLEANIISEEEYRKGKTRIEKRLDEIRADVEEAEEQLTVNDISEKEKKKETAADILKEVEEEEKEIEQVEKMPEEQHKQEDWVTQELKELGDEPATEKKEKTEDKLGEKEIDNGLAKVSEKTEKKPKAAKGPEKEAPKEKPKPKPAEEEDKEKPVAVNRKTLRIVAIIAIIIMIFLLRRSPDGTDSPIEEEFKPVCAADEGCIKPGSVGICLNPGTEEASCEFYKDIDVSLTLINDPNCPSCDTSRMLSVLRQLFPGLKKATVGANTAEGEALINKLGIKALPAYVFGAEINETIKFDKFKRALVKKGDNYVVTPTASGANYFFARPSKPGTIDLYVEAGQDTTIIDNSLNEVIILFGSKITLNRHIVEKADKAGLSRELAITTYPAYLINNRLKYTGTQAAEIVKNRFCHLNNFQECDTTLSVDITS